MVITLAAVAFLWAALVQRYGTSPIAAAQGSGMPFAGRISAAAAHAAHAAKRDAHRTPVLPNVVARKADDRARPRGRRL